MPNSLERIMQEVERKMGHLAKVGMIARGTRHRLCFTALSPQKHNLYKHVYIFFYNFAGNAAFCYYFHIS